MPEIFRPEQLNESERKSAFEFEQLEKLKGFPKKLWEKARNTMTELKLAPGNSDEWPNEAKERIKGIENGSEDDESRFLDLEVTKEGKTLEFRTIAQIDPKYNPDRKKNYDEWNLTPQEEAERWLNREIIIGESLSKYSTGEQISADKLVDGNRNSKSGNMYILKEVEQNSREPEKYGREEGAALARTLLDLQNNLKATEMVQNITSEEGIETKLELEQKIFEDYFDHFDGYAENTGVILGEVKNKKLRKEIGEALEGYRSTIEETQLEGDEYSLAHGNCKLENVVYNENGRALLKDWQRSGTTQNRELSLVYDFGDAMKDAVERFDDPKQAEDFISGIEEEVARHYENKNARAGEAVVDLAKFRSFAEIINDAGGKKKAFIQKQLNASIARAK